MKKFGLSLLTLAVAGMLGTSLLAQPPEGRRRDGDRPPEAGARDGEGRRGDRGPRDGDAPRDERGPRDGEGRGPGRGPGFGPPPNPLVTALDTDEDGVISAKEIENAAASLKKLDKNGDGKLTADEMRPDFGGRGPGGPPEGRRGEDRFKQLDKNGDGKLTKDELPEQMQRMLERGDNNKDGALDRAEIEELMRRFRGQGRGREGDRRPEGDRPPRDGDRPPRDGDRSREGDRPRRPDSDDA